MRKAIERKLITYLGIVLLILMALSLISYLSVNRLASSSRYVSHTLEVEQQIEAVLAQVQDAETRQRGYLLTAEGNYLRAFRQAVEETWTQFRELRRLTADNPEQGQR